MFIAPPIMVSPDASDEEQTRKLQEMQATLDELRSRGADWTRRGSGRVDRS